MYISFRIMHHILSDPEWKTRAVNLLRDFEVLQKRKPLTGGRGFSMGDTTQGSEPREGPFRSVVLNQQTITKWLEGSA
jgi:hypothetical protein